MIIAVDFDGVICKNDEWPRIGEMMPGAVESINRIRQAGHCVIINTCRCNGELFAAVDWMKEKGIGFDYVNDNHPRMVSKYGNNSRKIYADVYIDDRNLGGFQGWDSVIARRLYDPTLKFCPSAEAEILQVAGKMKEWFGVSMQDMQRHTKEREIVDARYMIFWYARKHMKLSFKTIGRIFTFDHATVLYGVRQTEKLVQVDREFRLKFVNFQNHCINVKA